MIRAVDKGDTGKLSFENFETVIMRKIMALDSDGDIMKSFRLFDDDDSGTWYSFVYWITRNGPLIKQPYRYLTL